MKEPQFLRLQVDQDIKPFDCGDADLNDFLMNEAKAFQRQLLAVTYLIENDTDTIAFFSVLNDKISVSDFQADRTSLNRFNRRLPNAKRLRSYPAVKLARLGVSNAYKGAGYGTLIVDALKQLFALDNKAGCKFLTVDAYRQALPFYERNGFSYLTTQDAEQDTRLMYVDLTTLTDTH